MTNIYVTEDSNNPRKYLIIGRQDSTQETISTTRISVSALNNEVSIIEINKGLRGEPGQKGDTGVIGPPGLNGLVFDVLPISSGGTNASSYTQDRIIYYDGTKLSSSNININNIQTDVISNIYTNSGLSNIKSGSNITINANVGNGLLLNEQNQISINNDILTKDNLDLSENYIRGRLPIAFGGTNNTFFGQDKLIYFDGTRISSMPLGTGELVFRGQKISIVAGSGLTGGGEISIPDGSVVIQVNVSDDISIIDDKLELSVISSTGIYSKVKIDTKGRVVEGSQITNTDVISALGFIPWHSGNDGAGSALDADLLDGQQGYYYRNAGNITGTFANKSVLPDTFIGGTYIKTTFDQKGLATDFENLNPGDITDALGFTPLNDHGGTIDGSLSILGSLTVQEDIVSSNVQIGSFDSSIDPRSIKFRYGDNPQRTAILSYYPSEQKLKLFNQNSSGTVLLEEIADSKYVSLTVPQTVSGSKTFVNTISLYGRLIIHYPKYNALPPFDINGNDLLVSYLNADMLDDKHGFYYRNAANLTGTLYAGVIIPHLEDNSDIDYIPKFFRDTPTSPMMLKSSVIFETGTWIVVEDSNLSVGSNTNATAYQGSNSNSLVVGTNNTVGSNSKNSFIAGNLNQVSGANSIALNYKSHALKNNSIAMGRSAYTWIDNQISLGGFETTSPGINNQQIRESQGQLSIVPLKFHGQSPSWTNILSFKIEDNKTLEYNAELLFTKQVETGVASFVISTGIVKSYTYREPPNYVSYKKAIMVLNHTDHELYNNSQARTYALNISATNTIDTDTKQSSLKITTPPLQYVPINIQDVNNPIIIKPKNDYAIGALANKSIPYAGYRTGHVIKLSPFSGYPYNTGAFINQGTTIHNMTECLYSRVSGEKEVYIKFLNHGISQDCPLNSNVFVNCTGGIDTYVRTDNNFDFSFTKQMPASTGKLILAPLQTDNKIKFRNYLQKNIIGNISGTFNLNVYRTTPTTNNPPELYMSGLNFSFYKNNISTPWNLIDPSKISDYDQSMTVTNPNLIASGFASFTFAATINPILGRIDCDFGENSLSGLSIVTGTNNLSQPLYYIPTYTFDTRSLDIAYSPYTYKYLVQDDFKVHSKDTIKFIETQRVSYSGNVLSLLANPQTWKERTNYQSSLSNHRLILNEQDTIQISGINSKILSVQKDNNGTIKYTIDYSFANSGISDISISTPISGIGTTTCRKFELTTGTYSFSQNINELYSITDSGIFYSELVSNGLSGLVPTGTQFTFDLERKVGSGLNTILTNYKDIMTGCVSGITSNTAILLPDIQLFSSQTTRNNLLASGDGTTSFNGNSETFKINNKNTIVPFIVYSGYNGVANLNNSYILVSGGTYLYLKTDELADYPNNIGNLSYRLITKKDNNKDSTIEKLLTVDPKYPSFQDSISKNIEYTSWLSQSLQGTGKVRVNGGMGYYQDKAFTFVTSGMILNPNFIDPTLSPDSSNIPSEDNVFASGVFNIVPYDLVSWTGAGLSSPGTGIGRIHVYENHSLSSYTGILGGYDPSYVGINNGLSKTIVKETIELKIASISNTGIFNVFIDYKQPYQTLTITQPRYSELLRHLSDNNFHKSDRNLNIGYKTANTSGIFISNNYINKFRCSSNMMSNIYGIDVNSNSFNVAVRSGVFNYSLAPTGNIVLNNTKTYEIIPKTLLEDRDNDQQISTTFNGPTNILKNGIYDIIGMSGQSLYIYDFAKSFDKTTSYASGLIHYNHTAHNLDGDKFSIWGRDFNGDRIAYPYRDVSVFIGSHNISCASGYLCIRISGLPVKLNSGDKFWIDIDPDINPQSTEVISKDPCSFSSNTKTISCPDINNLVLGMNVQGTHIPDGSYIVSTGAGPTINISQNTESSSSTTLSFSRETEDQNTKTTSLRTQLRDSLMGPYTIYNGSVAPDIVTIIAKIPGFINNPSDPYYLQWNTLQDTRGINIWRNENSSSGSAIMITGYRNIQTDKNPNYNNVILSMNNSFAFPATAPLTLYATGLIPTTGLVQANNKYSSSSNCGYFNMSLCKYLVSNNFNGLLTPAKITGIITDTLSLSSSDEWTVNSNVSSTTPLLVVDNEDFVILGADIVSPVITGIPKNNNYYEIIGLNQTVPTTIRIGIRGGAGNSSIPPEINVYKLRSEYTISSAFQRGIPISGGISNPLPKLDPFSNVWYTDIFISGISKTTYFDIEATDIMDNRQKISFHNFDGQIISPSIINLKSTAFYGGFGSSPWVTSFDIKDLNNDYPISISGSTYSGITIIASGLSYTSGLNLWQGYLMGTGLATNSIYPLSFGASGLFGGATPSNILNHSFNIKLTGVNAIYGDTITNIPTGIILNNINTSYVPVYFNYQKTTPYIDILPTTTLTNLPSGISYSLNKISTPYTQLTARDLYLLAIGHNSIPVTYNLSVGTTYLANAQSSSILISILDDISISNIILPKTTAFNQENWTMYFSVLGGEKTAGSIPKIQLMGTPSKYEVGKIFDNVSEKWNISVTGTLDQFNRHNISSGIYDIRVYAHDNSSEVTSSGTIKYLCPVSFQNIKQYHGTIDKDYFINLEINNCTDSYENGYSPPTISPGMPSNYALSYNHYNRFTNLNEFRYSGEHMPNKWQSRITISNLNNELASSNATKPVLNVDIMGLDTDTISVIGLLKLKELEASYSSIPLKIKALSPKERLEADQGSDWSLEFDVVGGLESPDFPPTIVLSGLPSLCSGYYPGQPEQICLSTSFFDTNKWVFAFTGITNCNTGTYNVQIKAFDTTGEDSTGTIYFFKPLPLATPVIKIEELSASLFPNCQISDGIIKYKASKRDGKCPYITGITGINIIGSVPPGLVLTYPETNLPLLPNNIADGKIRISGMPTAFPVANNIYPSFRVVVTDALGQTSYKIISYNTLGIIPMDKNPMGGRLYFANENYITAKHTEGNVVKYNVKSEDQKIYNPYPTTGLFRCLSTLSTNNCPQPIEATYKKLSNTGLSIYFGETQRSEDNVFCVFDNNLSYSNNGLYILEGIDNDFNFNQGMQEITSEYSGILTTKNHIEIFNNFPATGWIKYVPIKAESKTMLGALTLEAVPSPSLSNNRCVLGNGLVIETDKLSGKLRPSILASITGDIYKDPTVNNNMGGGMGGGIPDIDLMPGLGLSILPKFSGSAEVHQFMFSNCYESGVSLISGIIIPTPTVELTDPVSVSYSSQGLALATKCSFGTDNTQRAITDNWRALQFKYKIYDIINQQYYKNNGDIETDPSNEMSISTTLAVPLNSVSFSSPVLTSGTIFELTFNRNSDVFPTYKINSYGPIKRTYRWIQAAKTTQTPGPTGRMTYPLFTPVGFTELKPIINNLFIASGNIMGGAIPKNTDTNWVGGYQNYPPFVTGQLVHRIDKSLAYDSNANPYNLIAYNNGYIEDGLWAASITGIVNGLTGTIFCNYDLKISTDENSLSPMVVNSGFTRETHTTYLPVTLLNPLSFYSIPTISDKQSYSSGSNTINLLAYTGQKFELTFTLQGGDRPSSTVTDINAWATENAPTIELNHNICLFDIITESYNNELNQWTFLLRSQDLITSPGGFTSLTITQNAQVLQTNLSLTLN